MPSARAGGERVEGVLIAVDDDDAGACGEVRERTGAADAAGAGDQHAGAFKTEPRSVSTSIACVVMCVVLNFAVAETFII